MPAGRRKSECLTERQYHMIREEYDLIPVGNTGKKVGKERGLVRELARKWDISLSYLSEIIKRTKEGR